MKMAMEDVLKRQWMLIWILPALRTMTMTTTGMLDLVKREVVRKRNEKSIRSQIVTTRVAKSTTRSPIVVIADDTKRIFIVVFR
jgi:hypothetical protein